MKTAKDDLLCAVVNDHTTCSSTGNSTKREECSSSCSTTSSPTGNGTKREGCSSSGGAWEFAAFRRRSARYSTSWRIQCAGSPRGAGARPQYPNFNSKYWRASGGSAFYRHPQICKSPRRPRNSSSGTDASARQRAGSSIAVCYVLSF